MALIQAEFSLLPLLSGICWVSLEMLLSPPSPSLSPHVIFNYIFQGHPTANGIAVLNSFPRAHCDVCGGGGSTSIIHHGAPFGVVTC